MCPFQLLSVDNLVFGVLESTPTTGAAKKVAVGFWISVVGAVLDGTDRLIRRRLISRIAGYEVSCSNRGQGRLDL
jgi:hypothetical protein